jgi:hypothetical protein
MATPGGRAPSAPPPPRPSPQRRPPAPLSPTAARASVLRWGFLMGGLVIIVDLSYKLVQQRLGAATGELGPPLLVLNFLLNAALFVTAGVATARDTGSIRLAVLAGFLAGVLDGLVLAAAESLAPQPGQPTAGADFDILLNATIGTLLAAAGGWGVRLAQRRGP